MKFIMLKQQKEGKGIMKKVVSISLGSSKRDHKVETKILGCDFSIERIGTDGDKLKAIKLIKELDGKVDAFGMGGIDIYLRCKDKNFTIRDSKMIREAAKQTPILDGTFLKDTLERRTVRYVNQEKILELKGKNVLITSALDRFGMAEAFEEAKSNVIYGDAIFALGIPIKIKSYNTLYQIAKVLAPLFLQLPFEMIYPTGKEQNKMQVTERFSKFYDEADIIAGDFNYIKKYMPSKLEGKSIITNTVTNQDVEDLKARGVDTLVTTTPNFNGRSFGTNVMEATIIALLEKRPEEMTSKDFNKALDELGFLPRIEYLKDYKSKIISF